MECSTAEFSFDAGSLYAYLQTLSDVRKKRGRRYRLALILLLVVLAKLGGQDTPNGIADWINHRRAWLFEVLPFGLWVVAPPQHLSAYFRSVCQ